VETLASLPNPRAATSQSRSRRPRRFSSPSLVLTVSQRVSGEQRRPPGCPPFSFSQAPSLTPCPRAALPPWTAAVQQEQRAAGASRRGCWSSALDGDGGLDKPVGGAARDDAHHHCLELSDDGLFRLRLQFWMGMAHWKSLPHGEDRR
jgi:hypothetical protein